MKYSSEGLGLMFRNDWGTPSLGFLNLTLHSHLGRKDEDEDCSFRFGIDVGILGFHLAFGWFREYPL